MNAPLRIVLFREAQQWLAQGLELDVGVQAENLKDLALRLAIALDAESDAGRLDALPPAPKYFQDLWPLRAGPYAPDGWEDLCTSFTGRTQMALVA